MKSKNLVYILQALLAAVFFGASAPVAKLLLGDIAPVFLASFLYLGSGTGIALTKLTQRKGIEAGITRVCEKCLSKDRDYRYRDVGALARALLPFTHDAV